MEETMKKTMTAVLMACVLLPVPAMAQKVDASVPVTAAEKAGTTVTVGVDGMVCDFCAQSLKKEFKKDAAVRDVDISLDDKRMVLTLKPGTSIDDATIAKHIEYAGYKVRSIDRVELTSK